MGRLSFRSVGGDGTKVPVERYGSMNRKVPDEMEPRNYRPAPGWRAKFHCDRKLIAASGAAKTAPVCRCAARERSIMTGSLEQLQITFPSIPTPERPEPPPAAHLFCGAFFSADEPPPTNLCRRNNVARPYQPSGLFRRAPRSLDTSGAVTYFQPYYQRSFRPEQADAFSSRSSKQAV